MSDSYQRLDTSRQAHAVQPVVLHSVDTFDVFKRAPWLFLVVQFITALRGALVVPMIVLLYSAHQIDVLFAFFVTVVASCFDVLDGVLARRWNVVSRFGRFADPIADKIFYLPALIALNRFVQMQAIVIIVALEVALIVHRMVVLVGAKTADVSANKAGKWKAVFQCIVICALVLGQYLEPYSGSLTAFFVELIAKPLVLIAMILSGISLAVHLHRHGIIRLH